MRSSFRVGSVMGIPIRLHISLLLILPFLAWAFGNNLKAMAGLVDVADRALFFSPYVWGLLVAVALFGSVLLHELGHALAALRYRISTDNITLMLFGGVAQLRRMPEQPRQEAAIAIAGPVVSFATGALCYAAVPLVSHQAFPNLVFSLGYLGYINIFLGLFNLLPAFPMDGGRLLRAFLARNRPHHAATRIAATVGKVFAVGFGFLGLFGGNVFLIMIAFFIYMGASQESQQTLIRSTLAGRRVRDLMTSPASAAEADETVSETVSRMVRERRLGMPVVAQGRLVGYVSLEQIQRLPAEARHSTPIQEVMMVGLATVAPEDPIEEAIERLSEGETGRLPVVEDGRLVGVLSLTDVLRGFSLQQLGEPGLHGGKGDGRPRAAA